MSTEDSVIPSLSNSPLRQSIREHYLLDEATVLQQLVDEAGFSADIRARITDKAIHLIKTVRESGTPSIMENFLAEYGLTTKEGVALMCLAEALLRVPDAETIDDLIEDKISHGNWWQHLGHSSSPLVNASTWALLLTGKVIATDQDQGMRATLQSVVKRLGEPLVRTAVGQSMKELGRHFVLGTNIEKAITRARELEARGYSYSYDMLGEAARTEADARRYHLSYSDAITALSSACKHKDIRENPGISVKLSALHARYEIGQHQRVMDELVSRASSLAMLAKSANMGFNIDAEEADRLDISLEVIERILANPALKNWDGFGVVVQAFGRRASRVLDWLYALAEKLDRKIMVRLVKGAYWDTEIKRAQVLGLSDYPVFTRKQNTDIAYLCCARKLLRMTDRIYPQFATHNAHSVAAVLELAAEESKALDQFEFQRLHGMGEALHEFVVGEEKARCRIYAPVGEHRDLLAYLVRRLLENGANSSFVNQIVDTRISPEQIATDPITQWLAQADRVANQQIPSPAKLYGSERRNSKGWDITDYATIKDIYQLREKYRLHQWQFGSGDSKPVAVFNPADINDKVGEIHYSTLDAVDSAVEQAQTVLSQWQLMPAKSRANLLIQAADIYQANAEELFALLAREAGKSWLDAVGEVREAVDFAFYYARQIDNLDAQSEARGVVVCISPWNFPLAIFSGQIFAALAAGNTVIAKPSEQTSLIAARAVELIHQAGVPSAVLQLLPGTGATVGEALTTDPRIAGVCFTGSTPTAQRINRNMAEHLAPDAPLVAETGGLNAMIVDSSALPEQVVRDVLASAFQSAGQRCSALRLLYLQEDIADKLLEMLFGAMEELRLDNPWYLHTDVGPVIDQAAKDKIDHHCQAMAEKGRLLKQMPIPGAGYFVAPTVIKLSGIEELDEEIFGPVLHVATFKAEQIDQVVDAINARGYGLTFGVHSRIDTRVSQITRRIKVGNLYVNRNQIGAVVGSQPFGGEGLSGTGPKAGGPHYLPRFRKSATVSRDLQASNDVDLSLVQEIVNDCNGFATKPTKKQAEKLLDLAKHLAINPTLNDDQTILDLPGPTGETNQLSVHPRGLILCLGPGRELALSQALTALAAGNAVVVIDEDIEDDLNYIDQAGLPIGALVGTLSASDLTELKDIDAVISQADEESLRGYRKALAQRDGMLIPLINELNPQRLINERHLCVDTTAAGGNASLIASTS